MSEKTSRKAWEVLLDDVSKWEKNGCPRQKATYRFNCTNGFDHKTGDCLFDEFSDVSHFGCREEEFRNRVEEGLDGFLTFDDFISLCKNEQWINPAWEFYFYPGSETEYQVYIAYNPDEDIHYFFSHL